MDYKIRRISDEEYILLEGFYEAIFVPMKSFSGIFYEGESTMKEEVITEVMQETLPYLDNAQMKQLREVMGQALFRYEVTERKESSEEDSSNELIGKFIAASGSRAVPKRRSGIIRPRLRQWRPLSGRMSGIFSRRTCAII